MKTLRTISHVLVAGLLASALLVPEAPVRAASGAYEVAQAGSCHDVGQRYAAQMGGQLARATPDVRGGQQVCVIVVLLPARDGQRPRREEIVVPAG
jgi:hypothetical protein